MIEAGDEELLVTSLPATLYPVPCTLHRACTRALHPAMWQLPNPRRWIYK